MSYSMSDEESSIIRVFAGFVIILMAAGAVGTFMTKGMCGVASKTLDADNIIFNYEQFYDVSEAYKAKVQDISTHVELVSAAKESGDRDEVRRLTMELAALKSSCRTMASEYNADSSKINRNIFKSNDLPHRLQTSDCQ